MKDYLVFDKNGCFINGRVFYNKFGLWVAVDPNNKQTVHVSITEALERLDSLESILQPFVELL